MRLVTSLFIAATIFFCAFSAGADKVQSCQGRPYTVPDDFRVVCSATWQLSAPCAKYGEDAVDLWDKWKVTGQTSPQDSFIRPWLSQRIIVVGYELVKVRSYDGSWPWRLWLEHFFRRSQDQNASWFMVGSAIQPDGMIWLAPGQTHAKTIWAAGQGQPWPAKEEANAAKHADMIDLHGACFDGGNVSIFLTLYYVPL